MAGSIGLQLAPEAKAELLELLEPLFLLKIILMCQAAPSSAKTATNFAGPWSKKPSQTPIACFLKRRSLTLQLSSVCLYNYQAKQRKYDNIFVNFRGNTKAK